MRSRAETPLQPALLDSEAAFYAQYAWALDAFPTVEQVTRHLRGEIGRRVDEGWQQAEVTTNVVLLACALADTVDDYRLGAAYDFSQLTSVLPLAGLGVRAAGALLGARRTLRAVRHRGLHAWRRRWDAALDGFLVSVLAAPDTAGLRVCRL